MICQGNICRSPMAEGFFSHQINNIHSSVVIKSAGLAAVVNHSAEPKAQFVMKKYEIDISKHRARQVDDKLIRETELVLVMTKRQRILLEQQFLFAKGKTFLLGHFQNFEIGDPMGQDIEAFEKVYQQIELVWQDWKTRIVTC